MSGVKRFEHATLRVTDREAAVDFYTDVLGLHELDREGETVYLSCGLDDNYDLGLIEGGTGVDHFAIRLDDRDRLATYERRLEGAGFDTSRTDGAEPGQEAGLRLTLPTGLDLELVTVADASYHHPTQQHADRAAVAPRDVDHINVMSWDVGRDLDVLTDHLDFAVSDRIDGESGFPLQAWTRWGAFHHDVALSTADNVADTLHHLSFEVDDMDHIKRLADRLAAAGHELELGPSRHNAGANNFAYLWTPGGNRIEFTAEMATVDRDAGTGVRTLDPGTNTVSSWGGVEPGSEFLERGS
ncbi:MAG: VOC family protein [Salinirussus sp.]